MSVPKERHEHPFAVGKCAVPVASRYANGQWSVTFDIDFVVKLDDGRSIHVRKQTTLIANEQRGRKQPDRNTGEKS